MKRSKFPVFTKSCNTICSVSEMLSTNTDQVSPWTVSFKGSHTPTQKLLFGSRNARHRICACTLITLIDSSASNRFRSSSQLREATCIVQSQKPAITQKSPKFPIVSTEIPQMPHSVNGILTRGLARRPKRNGARWRALELGLATRQGGRRLGAKGNQ